MNECGVKHPEGCGVCRLEFGHNGMHESWVRGKRKLWNYTPKPEDRRGHAPMPDPVNHPSHYTSHPSGVECIQITEHMNFNLGSALAYIWRAGLKTEDGTEDLSKAVFHLQREIQRLKSRKK